MIRRLVAISLAALLLGGCYVRLPISNAEAEPIADNVAKVMPQRLARPPGQGHWYDVRIFLPRQTMSRIVRWEIYTHIYVEGCRTGELIGIGAIEEEPESDLDMVREILRSEPSRQTFAVSAPVFLRARATPDQLCLRLDGGSYTLQKVWSGRVPLKRAHR